MKAKRNLFIISAIALLASCANTSMPSQSSPSPTSGEDSSEPLQSSSSLTSDDGAAKFVAPERLPVGSHKLVKDYEGALASYVSFAKKAISSQAMRGEGNSAYSPFSHYLALATAYSSMVGLSDEKLAPFGVETSDDLAESAGKLIRLESLVNEYPTNGAVEVSNLIANFSETWSDDKIGYLVENLRAAYLSDHSNCEKAISEWRKELSYGMLENPSSPSLPDGMVTFLSGLYVDLPFGGGLSEETENRPFNGKGSYPFLVGSTSGKLYHNDDEVLAFEQRFNAPDYKIRYVMPKNGTLDDYLGSVDLDALFKTAQSGGEYDFELPSIEISKEWELSSLAKSVGMDPGIFKFTEGGAPHEVMEMAQSMNLRFEYDGVKAYSDTRILMIPQSEPEGIIKLNQPFSFDIIGRGGAVLIHGRVRTLDV